VTIAGAAGSLVIIWNVTLEIMHDLAGDAMGLVCLESQTHVDICTIDRAHEIAKPWLLFWRGKVLPAGVAAARHEAWLAKPSNKALYALLT